MLTEASGELSWGNMVVDAGVWILETLFSTGVLNAPSSGRSALTLIREEPIPDELTLTCPALPEVDKQPRCGLLPSHKPKEFPDHGCKG